MQHRSSSLFRIQDWRLSSKLIALVLAVVLVSTAAVQWIAASRSGETFLTQQSHALDAIRSSRQGYIEDYFNIVHEQIVNFARDQMIVDATAKFSAAFEAAPEQLRHSSDRTSAVYRSLERYYENDFRPRLDRASIPWRGVERYIPRARTARLLQGSYIAGNSYRVGAKQELIRAPGVGDYHQIHEEFHPRLRAFQESFGYRDIFLFDVQGNLVYSVFKETDYATNFLTGPYRNSNLARVYRQTVVPGPDDSVYIADYAPYEPSYGAPAMFIAAPVYGAGESYGESKKIGVVAFQMPMDRINRTMGDTAGLGDTGEIYLIGNDFLVRSKRRFNKDEGSVGTNAARGALAGESGTIRQVGYRGTDVLASFAPLEIPGLEWGIIAEMEVSEVTRPARMLKNRSLLIGLGVAIVIAAAAFFLLTRFVIRPVKQLVGAAQQIQSGDYSARIPVSSSDEIGTLGDTFNRMAESVASDIEQRKQAEAAMVRARQAADDANLAKSEFLSNMSHELRTPLNGVLGYVQILERDDTLTAPQHESLQAIQSCGQHLLTLINDVLDLSRIESGRLEVDKAACDFEQLLKGAHDIVRQRADAKGLELIWDVAPDIPRGIITDGPKLRQVLVNLLGNAVKFTDQGAVTLQVGESPVGRLRLAVQDTGVGMTPQELKQIFDPFKQVEGGKASGGTGLGLAISRKLVGALDGELTVASEPCVGSTFVVSMPLIEAEQLELKAVVHEPLGGARDSVLAPGQDINVLIADDRETNRDILQRLVSGAGFRTAVACDGAQALARLREQQFDLVLMDVRMPGMNGMEAMQAIRDDAALRETVVIAVSASVFPDSARRFASVGFDDFISKPLRATELFDKIEEHLEVRFIDRNREAVAKVPAEDNTLGPSELAPVVASRLRAAAALGDISELAAIVSDLTEQIQTPPGYAHELERLAQAFDFDGIVRLVNDLETTSEEGYEHASS